jgi:hypothetical protein
VPVEGGEGGMLLLGGLLDRADNGERCLARRSTTRERGSKSPDLVLGLGFVVWLIEFANRNEAKPIGTCRRSTTTIYKLEYEYSGSRNGSLHANINFTSFRGIAEECHCVNPSHTRPL